MVSRVILGCGNFGGIGSAPDLVGKGESEDEAFAILDAADEMGITVLDTADAYGGGRSEATIGRWLAARGPEVRERMLITTKAFNPVGPGPNDRGLSRRHLKRQVERSLKRLGTDRIDLFMTHEPDAHTPLEESIAALDDLVRAGAIHYIGASNIEAWRLVRALWLCERHGYARFAWVQNSYSLLERAPERELFPALTELGLGFTPFSPLAGGWLTGKYRRDEDPPDGSRMTLRPGPYSHLVRTSTFDALDGLRRRAEQHGTSMAALALGWLLHQPAVTAVVVGPRSPAQLEPAREALALDLPDEEWQAIGELFVPDR
jgi:aryl-alcohol dehydrogenase-like predicted oxidoreductase